jgi:hypothetical protein
LTGRARVQDSKFERPFFLCEEFRFAALLSQVSEFRLQHTDNDDEIRKSVDRIEKQNL